MNLKKEEPEDWLKKPTIDDDTIFMDCSRFYASILGKEIRLTTTEFKILYLLAAGGGKIVTRNSIRNIVTGRKFYMNELTVNVHISAIRRKLPEHSIIIVPVNGLGYRYELLNPSKGQEK